jgi:mitochondrial import receptor subunit TOM40
MNSIRAITKKVEAIKGFRFEVAAAASNNFHLSHSWNINNFSPNPKGPLGSYTLAAQYIGGELKTMMDQPKFIMTGRFDSSGKLEAAIIKKLSDRLNLRLSAIYPNSDILYSQMHLDLDIEGWLPFSEEKNNYLLFCNF